MMRLPIVPEEEEEEVDRVRVRLERRMRPRRVGMVFALTLGVSLVLVGFVLAVYRASCEDEEVSSCTQGAEAPLFLLLGGLTTFFAILCLCLCEREEEDEQFDWVV